MNDRSAREADMTPVCDPHGPMKHRPAQSAWYCYGFDGEGCIWATTPIPDDAVARVGSGQTRWPGIDVVAGHDQRPGQD